MRQDPDIIMVGEIRDLATAEMAIQAALTGHLVFSTLHTNDAASAITRLVDLGVPPYLIGATVVGVLSQRPCARCARRARSRPETTRETLQQVIAWRTDRGMHACKPVGCLECRMTGYRGRAGLYELLTVTEPARAISPQPDLTGWRSRSPTALRLAAWLRRDEGRRRADDDRGSAARDDAGLGET